MVMKMASRNIASMHLFLEMKKKFPDLPEDTLRNYACLYAQDQQKCVNLLQRENKNHFPSRPQFTDARAADSKAKQQGRHDDDVVYHCKSSSLATDSEFCDIPRSTATHSGRSTSHAGVVRLPSRSTNLNVALSPDQPRSAPVLSSNARPFADMYRTTQPASSSSHYTLVIHQVPVDSSNQSQATTRRVLDPNLKRPTGHQFLDANHNRDRLFADPNRSWMTGHQVVDPNPDRMTGHQVFDPNLKRMTGHEVFDQNLKRMMDLHAADSNQGWMKGHQGTDPNLKRMTGHLDFDRNPHRMTDHEVTDSNQNRSAGHQDPNPNRMMVADPAPSRMMFSTTQEHQILPIELEESSTPHKQRHAVSLSITPAFPFAQQQANLQGVVSSPIPQSNRPGRHTTSVNLQLQSPLGSPPSPFEISTIPTNLGRPSSHRDFGSHLQISVGAQGATFTALRLQRPAANPPFSVLEQPSTRISSQSRDSSVPAQVSGRDCGWSAGEVSPVQGVKDSDFPGTPVDDINPRMGFMHGYQASPDYINAVKKHQFARLDLVVEELNKEKLLCSELRNEVDELENQLSRRMERENSLSHAELLQRLKEENRKLQIECNCLLMEYDLNSKGQIDIGVTDEDFYSNIFTGPNDGLSLSSSDGQVSGQGSIPSKVQVQVKVDPRARTPSEEDDEDERNRWKCKRCTFANHPALEKCEICEIPRDSGSFFVDS